MFFKLFKICLVILTILIVNINSTPNQKLPIQLTEHPESKIAQIGAPVTFKCAYNTAENSVSTTSSQLNIDNNIKIEWLFNMRKLKNNNIYRINQNRLVINSYKSRVDSGEYRCLINNTLFQPPFVILSEPATLSLAHIKDFPVSKNVINSISLSEGNVGIISCELPESNPKARPIFYHNNVQIIDFNEQGFSRFKIFPSGNLQINNVKTSDSGVYTCSAQNPITNEIKVSSIKNNLKVYEPFGTKLPEIAYVPTDTNRVKIGANLTLECVANGAPVPLVSWEKFGGILPPKRSRQVFGNLILVNVQPEDKGTYVCRAETGPGQATFKTSMVDVFEAPTVIKTSPSSHITIAREGQSIELICPIQSRPRADITWFYQGQKIQDDNTYKLRVVGDKSILTIRGFIESKSAGIFQCFAKNEYGTAQSDLLVIPNTQGSNNKIPTISSRPIIRLGPQNVTIYEGQTVVLLCITDQSAGKTTQINWLQNELIIEPTLMRRFEINQVLGNLRIVSTQKSDAGVYKCIASNEFGMSTAESHVRVVNNGEEIKIENNKKQHLVSEPKSSLLSSPIASRASIKQIGSDKILLNWELIDSITGLVINTQEILNTLAYFKVEYKTGRQGRHRHRSRISGKSENPPANIWLTIDEQIDPNKREYILTDLSKFETYRFRITTFYLNGDLTNSHSSLRFRLKKTWTERKTKKTRLDVTQLTDFHLSKIQVQITQIWAIASSSLGLRWKLNSNLPQNINQSDFFANKLDGFYIYYRQLSKEHIISSVNSDGHIQKIDTQNIPKLPIVNYTRIKVPITSIDSYMIENLAESSVYEIKMSCYNLIGDLCTFSNSLYGTTLKSSGNNDIYQEDISLELEGIEIENKDVQQSIIIEENKIETNNDVLFVALGSILAIVTLVLVVFIIMCIIRNRQHKRLLAQLHNTSQKMTSSSCPTLIYEDSLRQNCRSNYAAKILEANVFNSNSTQDSNSTNSQSMSTTASMITPPNPGMENGNIPSHVLLMNGNTVQGSIPPPPIPQVPPPNMYSGASLNDTLNRMNINLNPMSNNNQENFYHTLTTLGNLPQPQNLSEENQYADYATTTMNLRAQLLLKQQQQQQQQQFFINTLKTLNMKHQQQSAAYLAVSENSNPKSPSGLSMRRNNSVNSSKKSKKSLRRDRSENLTNQGIENNQEIHQASNLNLQMPNLNHQLPNNYYLLPTRQQQQNIHLQNQDTNLLNIEAQIALQNQNAASQLGLFSNNGGNATGIYLLNNYLASNNNNPIQGNLVNNNSNSINLNGENEPLMFSNNNFEKNGNQKSCEPELRLQKEDMSIEEQEKEPLQS